MLDKARQLEENPAMDNRNKSEKHLDFIRLFGDRLTLTNVHMDMLSLVDLNATRPRDEKGLPLWK